ncbi:hypothetical protein ACFFKH_19130 [Micromonospora marina]|uniref:hypothetical protein n=1 Tax=Micromonospora marina TaxID=307120 RepID=UPI001FC951EA|nr:hypothetical protein [Micromonospora marina]
MPQPDTGTPPPADEPGGQRGVSRPHRLSARGDGDQAVPREPGRGHRRGRTSTPTRPATVAGRRRRAGLLAGRRPTLTTRPDGDPELDGADDPPDGPDRRRIALAALVAAAAISAATLVAGLLTWIPGRTDETGTARPLTAAEADRVAALRVTNLRDVRAGVRVTVGAGTARTELVGWVDWARPLVYLDVGGPGAGGDRGLVQATASALLVRPDPGALPTPARPPLVPPADRWRMRSPAGGHGLGAVRDLLIGLGADRVDPPAEGRWLRGDRAGGVPVDVLQAPLAPLGDPRPALWVDADARLHRLTGRLADSTPVTVDLTRADRATVHPVDALGGRAGQPRAPTDDEAARLAALPARLRALRGAPVAVDAPLAPSANLRATGTVNWASPSAYLAVSEEGSGRRTLRWVRPGRVAEVPRSSDGPATPPAPVPAALLAAPAGPPGDDLDRLLDAALRAARRAPAGDAVRVREDRLGGRTTVDVFEVPGGRRWWLDRGGLPHRLELRTGPGVWIRLDLTAGRAAGSGGSAASTAR